MRKVLIILSFILIVMESKASEFPWYKYEQFQGWVETTNSSTNYIYVLPFVISPGSELWSIPKQNFQQVDINITTDMEGFEITNDNKVKFGYKIISTADYLPTNLKQEIYKQTNINVDNHFYSFVKVKKVAVFLEIGKDVFEKKMYNSELVSGDFIDYFYIDIDDYNTINKIRNGDFRFRIEYEFPYNNYSSLELEMTEESISNLWVNSFKQITKRVHRSGGRFLFLDWSRAAQSVRINENFNSNENTEINNKISVVLRDANPEMQKRFEAIIGQETLSESEIIELHMKAAIDARNNGKPSLADAHTRYVEILKLGDQASVSGKMTEKLLSLVDSDILSFLMSGVKMSTSSSNTYFRYNSSISASVNTQLKKEYKEYWLNSCALSYSANSITTGNISNMFDRVEQSTNMKVFGVQRMASISKEQWIRAVIKAIENRDIQTVNYCFDPKFGDLYQLINPNQVIDSDGNIILHKAIETRNLAIVKKLLDEGADPNKKNRFQESSIDIAEENNLIDVLGVLDQYRNLNGTAIISFDFPNSRLINIEVLNPEGLNYTNSGNKIIIEGFPIKIYSTIKLTYQINISHSYCNNIRFPYRRIRNTQNGILIEFDTFVRNTYKIRDSRILEYTETIVFKDFNSGFVKQ